MAKDITGDIRVFLDKYAPTLNSPEELQKRLDNLTAAISVREKLAETNVLAGDKLVQSVSERFIIDAAARYAHQLAFRLFEEGNLDDKTNLDFRALPTPDQTDQIYREVEKELMDAKTALETQVNEHQQKERILATIQQVLLGQVSEEEAIKRFETSQEEE